MLSEYKVIDILLEQFPNFRKYWEQEMIELFGDNAKNLSSTMVVFSHYIKNLIIINNKLNKCEIRHALELIEQLMAEGENSVQNAVATCFLENLINTAAWGRISSSSFIPFLGKESKEYCKAWDEFTGVKTKGLWDDENQ